MLVSEDWLGQYVSLPASHDHMVDRLTMSGLNHEGTQTVGQDRQIDLEVTSNRSDCLGHIGVAREIAVLFDSSLHLPAAEPAGSGAELRQEFGVRIECPGLCYRFTARLIRGVRIGPSPAWLVNRLATVGIESVNNIVDISNYVMLECGQPLHVFDYDRLQGGQIVVREPRPREQLVAINHATYDLQPGMVVIADGQRAVGLGGVMGGADTEVSEATRNVLVEAAWFNPMAIRATARKLNLHSAASFRFERTIDPDQIDWASRRCCQLILELAGGDLAAGAIDEGSGPEPRAPIEFRQSQIRRVLGIEIPADRVTQILKHLGFAIADSVDGELTVTPPSWRRDVSREIDLIEEVGRVHGYEHVPDNIPVPMSASVRSHADRALGKLRGALTGAGLDEAITASLVPEKWCATFSPWTPAQPLCSSQPMLGVLDKASQNLGPVNVLRQSLIPSLLEVFRINEYKQNTDIHLFEIGRVYLANGPGLPDEPVKLGLVSEFPFERLKGVVESLLAVMNPRLVLDARSCDVPLLDRTRAAELFVDETRLGWMGEVSESGRETFSLRRPASVAELDLDLLIHRAVTVVRHADVSPYPAITRDFNFVLDESVRWADLSRTVRESAGPLLESVAWRETFRDPGKDGAGKKRILLTVVLRSATGTLTREQAESACAALIRQCEQDFGAALLA